MNRSSLTRRATTITFFAAYATVAIALWLVAYGTEDDKSRGALIATAGAVTGGLLAVAGGWFNAWRTGLAQEARELATARRTAYAEVVNLARDLEYDRSEANIRFTAAANATQEAQELNRRKALDHWIAARALRRQLLAALTTAEASSEGEALAQVKELKRQIEGLKDSDPEIEAGALNLSEFENLLQRTASRD